MITLEIRWDGPGDYYMIPKAVVDEGAEWENKPIHVTYAETLEYLEVEAKETVRWWNEAHATEHPDKMWQTGAVCLMRVGQD